jgi:CubicO group peptidase (beta-lactamase class C family)
VQESSTKIIFRTLPALVCSLLLLASFALFAQAPQKSGKPSALPPEAQKTSAPAVPGQQTHELTAEDLSSFLDGLVPLQIQRADIAGAVIAVTKDGKLFFAKGYGYSDVAKKAPVNPETTLFRPGSISKTFTWTAVMQQVEQGKLDLDRDVNDYLDFKVPPKFGKPITLRNIMTHTSGFEETVKDLFVGTKEELRPMGQYLQEHMPERIFPPGTTPAYSNYATTMAAPSLLPDMSTGYVLGSGEPKHFEWVQVAPAGSASISAVDMTHWMIMHLQNGKYGDVQILKPETAIAMHARQQGPWPDAINAMCLGFYEESQNGHRIIGHGGDTLSFHSDLHLLLNDNVGFFVSYNSPGRDDVSPRGVLFDKFMERYFPNLAPAPATAATAAADAQSAAGRYSVSRRFETNVLSVIGLLGETKIAVNPKDNTIAINGQKDLNGQPKWYREIGPMVFQDVNGHDKLAFTKNYEGRQVFFMDFPFMVFQRVTNPFDNQAFNYWIIGFSLAVVVLTIIFWPIAAMLRKHYQHKLELDPAARRLRMWVRLACFGILIFCIGLLTFVSKLSSLSAYTERGDFLLHLLQFFGLVVGLFGSLIAIYGAIKIWGGANWFWYKLWSLFQAVACVLFFWFIWYWHLLNFHLNY